MSRYSKDYVYDKGRKGIRKTDDPTIKIKPKELGVGALLLASLASLSGKKNKASKIETPVSKPKNIKKPVSKPKTKNLSSKFQKTSSGEQAKVSADERLKEIKREDAMDEIKKIAQGKMNGGALKQIPPKNKGLSKLPTSVRNQMGFKKYGGKTKGMMGGGKVKPYGMKHGGMCKGMGAATRGGKYKAT